MRENNFKILSLNLNNKLKEKDSKSSINNKKKGILLKV